uniref:Uncharacterized protein n=1 Tax=Opuntia streptacantha TaxID=393608 RepID=A0A7C9FBD8_OPUST
MDLNQLRLQSRVCRVREARINQKMLMERAIYLIRHQIQRMRTLDRPRRSVFVNLRRCLKNVEWHHFQSGTKSFRRLCLTLDSRQFLPMLSVGCCLNIMSVHELKKNAKKKERLKKLQLRDSSSC